MLYASSSSSIEFWRSTSMTVLNMLNMLFSSFTEDQYVINEDKNKVRNCCQWVYLAISQKLGMLKL